MNNIRLFIFLFYFLLQIFTNVVTENADSFSVQTSDTLLEQTKTLLVSTIDGYLTAVDAQTGLNKWRFKEGPLLVSPKNVQRGFTFIPDPRDGQLYLVIEGRITKLPFTIPHLVRVSPCRSSEGIFYAGSKKDVWISVNPETGERVDILASSISPSFCPANHAHAIHIGKTEYQIQMVDTKRRDRHWNATFVDYSSHLLPEDTDYPLQHLTSSADGRVLTVDSRSGLVLWQRDFDSVIVNMYLLKGDGMHRLPSTAIGLEAFDLLVKSVALNPLLHVPAQFPNRLFPTLYVGESTSAGGLYALPAFVDERTNRISPKYLGPPLLEGPKFENNVHNDESATPNLKTRKVLPSDTVGTTYTTEDGEFLILGYHEVPKMASSGIGHIFSLANSPFAHDLSLVSQKQFRSNDIDSNVRVLQVDDHNHQQNTYLSIDKSGPFLVEMYHFASRHPYQMSLIFSVMIALVIVSSCLVGKQSALTRNRSWSYSSNKTLQGSELANPERGSRSSQGSSVFTAYEPLEEDGPLGWHRVNNSALSYNSAEILGRGCEGTVVYMGKFDDRTVAVKRIVSSNLDRNFRQQIEREVMHLRQSDSHPNVIRYFCSEADRYFHYIALELCDLSLSDYIQRHAGSLEKATKLDLMKQATDGIAHLHHINIIHRDVKPKNILMTGISTDANNENLSRLRVKISDFGLCKSVKIGHNSISKVSGAVGTEGWMAPELFDPDASVTYAVDVFSLGCVFYYTLTDGRHPFGDSLSRMSNILSGNHFLGHLDENAEYTSRTLINSMLRPEARRRPTASAVAAHPLFWEPSKQLQFLMEVSDWIEKKEPRDPVMRRLEWRRNLVFTNWLDQLDEPLRLDLLKQRQYLNNVRDLLRAIRNKKHHYQELPLELRTLLGAIPVDYLSYFTTRFPMLLMHAFMSLACIGNESVFKNYYSPNQLRDFYENEQMALVISGMKDKRSISPTNWRSDGNVVSKQIQIMSQKQISATTTLQPSLQVSFDPSIPPPPIIKQQISPILKITEEIEENHLNGKENGEVLINESTLVVTSTNEKNQKSKNKNKRKKRKAPFYVLLSGE
ncbi:hypothetical protein ACQ4LE_004797, partial [Meloidogyne hapla]